MLHLRIIIENAFQTSTHELKSNDPKLVQESFYNEYK